LSSGADLSIKDNQEKTPFVVSLDLMNVEIIELLLPNVSFNKDPQLFFEFGTHIFNIEYQEIIKKIIKNDPPTAAAFSGLDDEGMTPFLHFVHSFTTRLPVHI
jgi:hypothetical protein